MSADFRGKGASLTNHCWCQKTRVIAVSYCIKIFAVRCSVLSQNTHLTDGRTDRQNCESNTVRCITCSRTVKTGCGLALVALKRTGYDVWQWNVRQATLHQMFKVTTYCMGTCFQYFSPLINCIGHHALLKFSSSSIANWYSIRIKNEKR